MGSARQLKDDATDFQGGFRKICRARVSVSHFESVAGGFLPVTLLSNEVITAQFLSPPASHTVYLRLNNTEPMWAGCMTWTVHLSRTLLVPTPPFRKDRSRETCFILPAQ